MRRIILLISLLLTACNLQQQPPTPTIPPTQPDNMATAANPAPTTLDSQLTPPVATLQPTPTQITLVTATLPSAAPTTVDFGNGSNPNTEGLPTMDAALADERYTIEVRAGASIGVNYEITIEDSGTVSMTLQGPDGVLWQQVFTASETGRAEVTVEQGGTYEVLVDRENLDGSYSVSWD